MNRLTKMLVFFSIMLILALFISSNATSLDPFPEKCDLGEDLKCNAGSLTMDEEGYLHFDVYTEDSSFNEVNIVLSLESGDEVSCEPEGFSVSSDENVSVSCLVGEEFFDARFKADVTSSYMLGEVETESSGSIDTGSGLGDKGLFSGILGTIIYIILGLLALFILFKIIKGFVKFMIIIIIILIILASLYFSGYIF